MYCICEANVRASMCYYNELYWNLNIILFSCIHKGQFEVLYILTKQSVNGLIVNVYHQMLLPTG